MGTSVISIRIVGNHGCQRDVGNQGTTNPVCASCTEAGAASCVDAVAKRFVAELAKTGQVLEANLLHWPESGNGPKVVDDLVTGKRHGSFSTT